MKTIYDDKYHFYYNMDSEIVVCTTKYHDKIIRGVAKCNPGDCFELATGKKLAYLRCKQKCAKKKLNRAHEVYGRAADNEERARKNVLSAYEFVSDALEQLDQINEELSKFEQELNI